MSLGERSYPIYIGSGLLSCAELLHPHIANEEALVVTNTTIAPIYLQQVLALLTGYRYQSVVLPDGEAYKNLDVLNTIFDALLANNFSRQVTIIALGGGVIGDMAGFAAASYQRGVPFIQIPTTLLAQVDSSVGGKTAVNHVLGKNMIGAFYQPQCVIVDTDTLDTLEDRQISSGLAEVIKYGLISDRIFFSWLEKSITKLRQRDGKSLTKAITHSCQNKADIVADDELEHGRRAILNLGHTFGHAIETATRYDQWLHGEAIAAGMMMASDLSYRVGWLNNQSVARIKHTLIAAGLPVTGPTNMPTDEFMKLMSVDKKVRGGRIRLVLLKEIGQSVISDEYGKDKLIATLEAFQQ